MRRIFFLILLALLLGASIAVLLGSGSGYMLLAYGNYTLETSLWIGIMLMGLASLAMVGVIGLLRLLLGGEHSLLAWLGSRSQRGAQRYTNSGLIYFIEGNWTKSRRHLLRGASRGEAPLLNYLLAARASSQLGEEGAMSEYLQAAEQSCTTASLAVALTRAELELDAGRYPQAAATLAAARKQAGRNSGGSPRLLQLLHRAYLGAQDWTSLAALLPALKKHRVLPASELQVLAQRVERGVAVPTTAKAAGPEGAPS